MQIPEIFIFEKNSTDYIIDAKCFFLITMIKIAVGKEWLQLFFFKLLWKLLASKIQKPSFWNSFYKSFFSFFTSKFLWPPDKKCLVWLNLFANFLGKFTQELFRKIFKTWSLHLLQLSIWKERYHDVMYREEWLFFILVFVAEEIICTPILFASVWKSLW